MSTMQVIKSIKGVEFFSLSAALADANGAAPPGTRERRADSESRSERRSAAPRLVQVSGLGR